MTITLSKLQKLIYKYINSNNWTNYCQLNIPCVVWGLHWTVPACQGLLCVCPPSWKRSRPQELTRNKDGGMANVLIIVTSYSCVPQVDHPLCLRLLDLRPIHYLISYIFFNLLRLTSDWFNWSREVFHKILDFASLDSKLWSNGKPD